MMLIKSIILRIFKKINIVKYLRNQRVEIGERCEIYSSAFFGSEPYLIKLGEHVRINHGVQFVTHDGGVWVLRGLARSSSEFFEENEVAISAEYKKTDLFGKIEVGNNVHIGTNSIIMPGVKIGNNCIIGCGSIVTKSIPDNSIAVGIPARVIENITDYY